MTENGHLTAAKIRELATATRVGDYETSLGAVYLRSLTEREASAFEFGMFDKQGQMRPERLRESRARLVSLCLCNADGQRLFEEFKELMHIDGRWLLEVYRLAREHCGLDKDDEAELEEMEKKSESASAGA